MAKMSRIEKYKELRESLQNDFGEELSTKTLTEYESRLNKIDANNFAAPADIADGVHEAAHLRKDPVSEPTGALENTEEIREPEPSVMVFGSRPSYFEEENEDDGDDYLDHVISEVKKYNIDQGNAVSENTQLNILSHITVDESPVRPLPRAEKKNSADTADIPFKNTFSERTSSIPEIEENTAERTVDDISAEVLNLMNEPAAVQDDVFEDTESTAEKSIEVGFPSEQATRSQMLHETMKMREQLDDYEQDLNEASDRMRHTNRILNTVLIALIAALLVVLGVLVWMIVTAK